MFAITIPEIIDSDSTKRLYADYRKGTLPRQRVRQLQCRTCGRNILQAGECNMNASSEYVLGARLARSVSNMLRTRAHQQQQQPETRPKGAMSVTGLQSMHG